MLFSLFEIPKNYLNFDYYNGEPYAETSDYRTHGVGYENTKHRLTREVHLLVCTYISGLWVEIMCVTCQFSELKLQI
jgi:hypothetical protein